MLLCFVKLKDKECVDELRREMAHTNCKLGLNTYTSVLNFLGSKDPNLAIEIFEEIQVLSLPRCLLLLLGFGLTEVCCVHLHRNKLCRMHPFTLVT